MARGNQAVTTAADATTEFFDDLGRRGHESLPERVTATFRFDLVRGGRTERWLVAVTKGDVAVSRQNRKADCILHADRELFNRLVSGKENTMAAVLRGEVVLKGDPTRFVLLQRLFPGPSASRVGSRPTTASAGSRS